MSLRDYFSNNRIFTGTEKPTQGKFGVGDIIVNIGPNSAEEPMWICVEAGTPGVWELCSGVNEEEIADIVQANALTAVDYTDGVDIQIDGGNIGNMNELQTTDKSSIVGAINELFQSANNGKELIASAIGEPVSSEDTFSAMSDKINNMKSDLKQVLTDEGVDVTEEDDMASLITKVDILLQDGEIIRPKGIKQTATGHYHTFILRNDGTLYSCGFNGNGQLGIGSTDTNIHNIFIKVNIEDVNKIACGGYLESGTYYGHTFAIKNDGTVWACGYGGDGQLGLGTSVSTFTQVNIDNVKQIACGGRHTFIIKNDGSLWACGYNASGQLGLGNTTNKTTFTQVTTNINNDVEYVACGYNHTFIIKTDGSVWSCGLNDKGQLGINSTTNKSTFTQVTANINNDVKQIACGHRHTFVLKNNGTVLSCGNNTNGEVGINYSGGGIQKTLTQVETDATHVFCGGYHTFILKNDGSLWACGLNGNGQLGLNSTTTQYDLVKVTENVADTISISCGQYHTLIIKNDGSVWTCGLNDKGQLGLNDTTQRTTFTQSYKQVIVFVE